MASVLGDLVRAGYSRGMTLSASEELPASQQLAAAIRAEIATGVLAPGAKLLAIRKLAELHGVAVGTAQAAVDLLRAENLVYASPGRGTFVRTGAEVRDEASGAVGADVREQIAHLASRVEQLAERVTQLESGSAVRP